MRSVWAVPRTSLHKKKNKKKKLKKNRHLHPRVLPNFSRIALLPMKTNKKQYNIDKTSHFFSSTPRRLPPGAAEFFFQEHTSETTPGCCQIFQVHLGDYPRVLPKFFFLSRAHLGNYPGYSQNISRAHLGNYHSVITSGCS